MFGNFKGELRCTQLFSACDNGLNYIALLNDASNAFFYDLRTMAPISGGVESVALGADYQYGAFIDDDSVVLASTATNVPKVVNVMTGTLTSLTAQTTAFSSGRCQNQIGVDRVNHNAMFGSSTAGRLVTVTSGSPWTSGNIQPTGLGSRTFQCVIHKTGSNDFIVGTDNGTIYELEFNGTINKTITLPTTPNTGTGQNHSVSSMVYDGDDLYVATHTGLLFHYEYSTSTLKKVRILRNMEATATGGVQLSNSFNRQFVVGSFTRPTDGIIWSLHRMLPAGIIEMDCILDVTFLNSYASMGVNVPNKLFWVACRSGFSTTLAGVKFFEIDGLEPGDVVTRAHAPADLDHRILRFANYKNCAYDLTVDQAISNGSEDGAVAVESPIKGVNEVEVSVMGTPDEDEVFAAWRYTV